MGIASLSLLLPEDEEEAEVHSEVGLAEVNDIDMAIEPSFMGEG